MTCCLRHHTLLPCCWFWWRQPFPRVAHPTARAQQPIAPPPRPAPHSTHAAAPPPPPHPTHAPCRGPQAAQQPAAPHAPCRGPPCWGPRRAHPAQSCAASACSRTRCNTRAAGGGGRGWDSSERRAALLALAGRRARAHARAARGWVTRHVGILGSTPGRHGALSARCAATEQHSTALGSTRWGVRWPPSCPLSPAAQPQPCRPSAKPARTASNAAALPPLPRARTHVYHMMSARQSTRRAASCSSPLPVMHAAM